MDLFKEASDAIVSFIALRKSLRSALADGSISEGEAREVLDQLVVVSRETTDLKPWVLKLLEKLNKI